MSIGAFSVSLSVKDIKIALNFYKKLGFEEVGGNISQNWLILRNGFCTIGLFQGMFEGNMLTFNPGWGAEGQEVDPFKDVRLLQEELRNKGIDFIESADVSTTGPAHFIIKDPDGNVILVDQHR